MRLPLLFGLLLLQLISSATGADSIAPGANLQAAVKTLQSHGYEVNSKYELAIVSRDENIGLDFCRIDDDITLVLAFDKSTNRITSLSIYISPDNPKLPKSIRANFVREILEMQLDEDGVYSLKLKRAISK
jgi:hypothetical protein